MIASVSLLWWSLAAVSAQVSAPVVIAESHQSVSPAVQEWEFNVPAFSHEQQVRLSLECRIDWPDLAGSCPWIRVAVNNRYVTEPDLLNKTDEFVLRGGMDLNWSNGDEWRVLYSPDFQAAVTNTESLMACPDADPYRYVWDVTRFVQPGRNKLRIHNLKVLPQPTTMVLRNVRLEVGTHVPRAGGPAVTPAPTGPLPTYVARPPRKVDLSVAMWASGGFALKAADKSYPVVTRTSLPGGKWHETARDESAKWMKAGQSAGAAWRTPQYELKRTVSVRDDHVHVADTIANLTGELIGVMVAHRLGFDEKTAAFFDAGRKVAAGSPGYRMAAHPSVVAEWKDRAIGLVAEDDVFRVHIRGLVETGAIGLTDEELGIEPGKSVTLEWSVYPVPGGDYWDFVNAVRRNWGCNFTIPGPFSFSMRLPAGKPPEWYGQWVRTRGMKIVCGDIAQYDDGAYAHGTGILHAPKWVARQKEWTQAMLTHAPEVRPLAYFHAQICTEPGGQTRYADCKLIDEQGKHVLYPHSSPLPIYLPTTDNSYGKALWGYVKLCLDEIGTAGLYWDEMSFSVLLRAYQAPWDGCTVIIDPQTHAILGKRTSVPLVMQPFQLEVAKYLRDRGKYLMANGQAMTRTMMNQRIPRFVETGTYSHLIDTHLGCPLGLGNHHAESNQADRADHARRILARGGLYYGHIFDSDPPKWSFQSVMYPVTPVELRPNVVLGQERIHTAASGVFGWPDGPGAADVYVVDANGDRVEAGMVRELTIDGKLRYEIRMPSDHFAILVRR